MSNYNPNPTLYPQQGGLGQFLNAMQTYNKVDPNTRYMNFQYGGSPNSILGIALNLFNARNKMKAENNALKNYLDALDMLTKDRDRWLPGDRDGSGYAKGLASTNRAREIYDRQNERIVAAGERNRAKKEEMIQRAREGGQHTVMGSPSLPDFSGFSSSTSQRMAEMSKSRLSVDPNIRPTPNQEAKSDLNVSSPSEVSSGGIIDPLTGKYVPLSDALKGGLFGGAEGEEGESWGGFSSAGEGL